VFQYHIYIIYRSWCGIPSDSVSRQTAETKTNKFTLTKFIRNFKLRTNKSQELNKVYRCSFW